MPIDNDQIREMAEAISYLQAQNIIQSYILQDIIDQVSTLNDMDRRTAARRLFDRISAHMDQATPEMQRQTYYGEARQHLQDICNVIADDPIKPM